MLRSLLAIGLAYSSLCISAFAESEAPMVQSSSAHLVLSFSRGTLNTHGATNSSVVMPMTSMAQCRQEGNEAISRNTKEFRSYFWCIERWFPLPRVLRYQEHNVFLLISCLSHWNSACLLTWFLQSLASFWLSLRWLSCLSLWTKLVSWQ